MLVWQRSKDLPFSLQALDEDQEGPTVVMKKLFEEDREFNQGTHTVTRFPHRISCSTAADMPHVCSQHQASHAWQDCDVCRLNA